MPFRLSAFADEISPDIQLQMDTLLENGIVFCCMRGANNKNVLDLEEFQVKLARTQFHNRGIRFSAIGSPVGKGPVTGPFEPDLEHLRKAARLAREFETKVIRIFTYCLPEGHTPPHQAEALRRLKLLADAAKAEGVNLEVENESGHFADSAGRLLEALQHIASPHVRAAFDFANFVQAGDDPLKAWEKLKKQTVDFHIKDFRASDRCIVPAGQGNGCIREILQDALSTNWSGFITLEPKLSAHPDFREKTGAERMSAAAAALKEILKRIAGQ